MISEYHWSLPLSGIGPRNLTLFTRLFLVRKHTWAGHKTSVQPKSVATIYYRALLNMVKLPIVVLNVMVSMCAIYLLWI